MKINEIKQRLENAGTNEWIKTTIDNTDGDYCVVERKEEFGLSQEEIEFILHAKNDMHQLLDEIEYLKSKMKEMESFKETCLEEINRKLSNIDIYYGAPQ